MRVHCVLCGQTRQEDYSLRESDIKAYALAVQKEVKRLWRALALRRSGLSEETVSRMCVEA